MHFPADDHELVYWPDEDSMSVISLSSIVDAPAVVGQGCQVRIGRKTLTLWLWSLVWEEKSIAWKLGPNLLRRSGQSLVVLAMNEPHTGMQLLSTAVQKLSWHLSQKRVRLYGLSRLSVIMEARHQQTTVAIGPNPPEVVLLPLLLPPLLLHTTTTTNTIFRIPQGLGKLWRWLHQRISRLSRTGQLFTSTTASHPKDVKETRGADVDTNVLKTAAEAERKQK